MEEWLAAEAPFRSVYRESPNPLYAHPDGAVSVDNPPPVTPGMAQVTLDGYGRLLSFSAVPYGLSDLVPPVQPETVFRAAGLDMAAFTETAPALLPPSASDQLRAWKGPHPKLPKTELTMEIASWKGLITRAQLIYPYSRSAGSGQGPSWLGQVRDAAFQFLPVMAAFVVALLARGNWKRERADRQGALRVAIARFVLGMVAWMGFMHPVPNARMKDLFLASVGNWLLSAAIMWIMYLALEPAVRARWPHAMVTWNRALAGQWLDPQVNGHVLIGAALGSLMWMAFKLLTFFFDLPKGGATSDVSLYFTLGTRQWIGGHAGHLENSLWMGLVIFLAMFGLRQILRYELLAALAASLLFTMTESDVTRSTDWVFMAAVFVALYMVLIFVLLRLGLVAIIALVFFINAWNAVLLGADWKAWYAPSGLATMLLLAGIAAFAFWRSLGSRELLAGEDAAS
jgi:serine/threonine-protein kinase